jgi:hypothetical protein
MSTRVTRGNNNIILLDYYEPFAGLCNQLYLITNHIHNAVMNSTKIYINKVNVDIFKKHRIPAESVFDFEKTNENIKRVTGTKPILLEKPTHGFHIPDLIIFPVMSVPILNCLEFKEHYYSLVPKVEYSGIHFRLDIDVLIHYLFERLAYDDFMIKCNNGTLDPGFTSRFTELLPVKEYINYLMNQYYLFIYELGLKNTWFICTSIGKNKINDVLLDTLDKLVKFIEINGGKVIMSNPHFEHRELNALVDLIALRDSQKLIVFEGSSFSEGYCLKVNSIRNPNKEYRTVNGIIPKLPNEIYFNC